MTKLLVQNPSKTFFSDVEKVKLESSLWDVLEQVKTRGIFDQFSKSFAELDDTDKNFIDKQSFSFLITKKFSLRLQKKELNLIVRWYKHPEFDDMVVYGSFLGDLSKFLSMQNNAILKVQCSWRQKKARNVVEAKKKIRTALSRDLKELSGFLDSEIKGLGLRIERLQFTIDKIDAISELARDKNVKRSLRATKKMLEQSSVKLKEVKALKEEVESDNALGQMAKLRLLDFQDRTNECTEAYRNMVETAVEQGKRLPLIALDADVRRLAAGWRALQGLMKKDVIRFKLPAAVEKVGGLKQLKNILNKAEAAMLSCAGVRKSEYDRDDEEEIDFARRVADSKRDFFSFHPKVNEALNLTTDAVRAAARSEARIEEERSRRFAAQNNMRMRCEEVSQRYAEQAILERERVDENHRKFIKLCKSWWSWGMERRVTEVKAKEEEDARQAKLSEEEQQRQIDYSVHNPWAGARIGVSNKRMHALMDAEAQRQRHQESRVFTANDADPDTGDRLLHNACWAGHLSLVKLLVEEKGADVNKRSDVITQLTPLHVAARAGCKEICSYLISVGAWMDVVDGSGDTPLHWAARRNHRSTCVALTSASNYSVENVREDRKKRIRIAKQFYKMITTRNHRKRLARDVTASTKILELLVKAETSFAKAFPHLVTSFAQGPRYRKEFGGGENLHEGYSIEKLTPKQRALKKFKDERDAAARKANATKRMWKKRMEKEKAMRMARLQIELERNNVAPPGDFRRKLLSGEFEKTAGRSELRMQIEDGAADTPKGGFQLALLGMDGQLREDAKFKI